MDRQGSEPGAIFEFEQQIRVQLVFRAMDEPVEISVPWFALRYLDTHAQRRFAPDGTVIYYRDQSPVPPTHAVVMRAPAGLVA